MGSSTEAASVMPTIISAVGQNSDSPSSISRQVLNTGDNSDNCDLPAEIELPSRTESDSKSICVIS